MAGSDVLMLSTVTGPSQGRNADFQLSRASLAMSLAIEVHAKRRTAAAALERLPKWAYVPIERDPVTLIGGVRDQRLLSQHLPHKFEGYR